MVAMNQFMSNFVGEGFSCHFLLKYDNENAEMQKRKFDDATLQYSIAKILCNLVEGLGYWPPNQDALRDMPLRSVNYNIRDFAFFVFERT